jgi:hypothetical protein
MRINPAWCGENRRTNYVTHPQNQQVDTDITGPQRKEMQKYQSKHNFVDPPGLRMESNSGLEEN